MTFALLISILLGMVFALTLILLKKVANYRKRALQQGHPSLHHFLKAIPVTDEEKREAVDLTLQGVVLCFLGFIFPPFLLLGLLPLYYGSRKWALSNMGFGLLDDGETPHS